MKHLRVNDPGRRTRARQLVFDPKPECPAALALAETRGGSGVRCAIEQAVLTAQGDPSSLASFCLGNYRVCPTWAFEKERIEEGRRIAAADDRRGQVDLAQYREGLVERDADTTVTYFEAPE